MVDIKYRFTCGDSDLSEIIKKCQNIMARVAVVIAFTQLSTATLIWCNKEL